jgi:hypothetical protein
MLDEPEDWYDDDSDDPEDAEWAPCPECGETVHVITGKCPACGYWLTDADRQKLYASESRPMWQKVTAVILLAVFLTGILMMMW